MIPVELDEENQPKQRRHTSLNHIVWDGHTTFEEKPCIQTKTNLVVVMT